jgi:hypothetical protein
MGEGLKRKAMLVAALVILTVGVDGMTRFASSASSTVPNYWPLPDGCTQMAPGNYEACRGCCITTVNTWLSPWCAKNTQPGPERDACNDGAVTWFKMCLEACGPSTSGSAGPANPAGN